MDNKVVSDKEKSEKFTQATKLQDSNDRLQMDEPRIGEGKRNHCLLIIICVLAGIAVVWFFRNDIVAVFNMGSNRDKSATTEAMQKTQTGNFQKEANKPENVTVYLITANSLNVRKGPGVEHDSLEKLPDNTLCVGTGKMNEDSTWVEVWYKKGQEPGWISQEYTSCYTGTIDQVESWISENMHN